MAKTIEGHFVKGIIVRNSRGVVNFSADVTNVNSILRASSAEDLRSFASELLQTVSMMEEEESEWPTA